MSDRPAWHAIAALMGEDWLITDSGREKMIEIAARENVITPEVLVKLSEHRVAVAARSAARMDGAIAAKKRDGVALIDVNGPIFRYADVFQNVSGGCSIDTLALDFNAAMDDPATVGVAFVMDSPGGQVKGVNEFAEMVYARRDEKPVSAYVGGDCASAAYWIASAVTPGLFWIDAVAFAGSIGAYVTARKSTQSANVSTFVSKVSPRKITDPETEAGKATMQKRSDDLGAAFVDSVARYRAVSVETVLSDFGGGDIFMGQQAVDAGLVDRVGSLEGLISEVKSRAASGSPSGSRITSVALGIDWRIR